MLRKSEDIEHEQIGVIVLNSLFVLVLVACSSGNDEKLQQANNTIKVEEVPHTVKPITTPDNSEKTIVFSIFYETEFIKTAVKLGLTERKMHSE